MKVLYALRQQSTKTPALLLGMMADGFVELMQLGFADTTAATPLNNT